MDLVYLDNNATTKPAPEVVEAMLPYLTEWYGNPSSVHRFGQRSRQALEEARSQVARLVGCSEAEILFTGGGTESVNTAVRGLLAARQPRRKVITSTVEHSAGRELCAQLEKEGAEVVAIEVDEGGTLDLDQLREALRGDDVALVSIMWANNETGVLSPVAEVAALCREHPSVERLVVSLLAERVDQLSRRLLEALYIGVEGRVFRRLMELDEIYGNGEPGTVIPLTQDDLAGLAGASRPTVNQVLARLGDQGVVVVGRGRIQILQPAGLRRLAVG